MPRLIGIRLLEGMRDRHATAIINATTPLPAGQRMGGVVQHGEWHSPLGSVAATRLRSRKKSSDAPESRRRQEARERPRRRIHPLRRNEGPLSYPRRSDRPVEGGMGRPGLQFPECGGDHLGGRGDGRLDGRDHSDRVADRCGGARRWLCGEEQEEDERAVETASHHPDARLYQDGTPDHVPATQLI